MIIRIKKKLKNFLFKFYEFVYEIFYLIKKINLCVVCYNPIIGNGLCYFCYKNLRFYNCKQCGICGEKKIENDCFFCNIDVLSVFIYEDTISDLILRLKYCHQYYISNILVDFIPYFKYDKNNLGIIYVPHYGFKQITTSINSSLYLAYSLQKKIGGSVIHHILKKSNKKRQKNTKNFKERIENPKISYELNIKNAKKIKDMDIILIDDVITTGSTVITCGKLLKKCNIKSLKIICITKSLYIS